MDFFFIISMLLLLLLLVGCVSVFSSRSFECVCTCWCWWRCGGHQANYLNECPTSHTKCVATTAVIPDIQNWYMCTHSNLFHLFKIYNFSRHFFPRILLHRFIPLFHLFFIWPVIVCGPILCVWIMAYHARSKWCLRRRFHFCWSCASSVSPSVRFGCCRCCFFC